MWTITKRELQNYLRNPLLWLGLPVIILLIMQNLWPYFDVHYFQSEAEISDLSVVELVETRGDIDVMDGYIPATEEQQMAEVYRQIQQSLMEGYGYTETEAEEIVLEMKQMNLSALELDVYMVEHYSFYNTYSMAEWAQMYRGSVEEINGYLKEKLDEHPYSFYFSRKFADFAGLMIGFFAVILLAFLFIRDTKGDTYELLHTKPISAGAYIGGKVLGGFLAMLAVLVVLNMLFGAVCAAVGAKNGLPARFWDIPIASMLYIVPNLLMIVCVYTVIAMLFKNPFPAVPLLFLYQVYSNMGSVGPDGRYGYYGRPLAIMVRFPGKFMETAPPPLALQNQLFLLAASMFLIVLSVGIWKRRR